MAHNEEERYNQSPNLNVCDNLKDIEMVGRNVWVVNITPLCLV